jgi:CHRD domain-containing protein
MKRLTTVVFGLLLTAGCSSSSSTPSSTQAGTTTTRFTAALSPASETPPVTNSEVSGSGTATIDFTITRDSTGTITSASANFTVTVTGFPATTTTISAAHIHPGATGATGSPIVPLPINAGEVTLTNGAGSFSRTAVTLTATTAQSILDNPAGFYFNIHTPANPGGAARGQLVKQ